MSPGEGAKRVDLLGLGRFAAARDRRLPAWADRLFRDLAPEHDSFAVRFVGDRTMRRLNLAFRGKDRTTDVLSFPGEPTAEGQHLGDVVISVPQPFTSMLPPSRTIPGWNFFTPSRSAILSGIAASVSRISGYLLPHALYCQQVAASSV